MKKKIMSLLCLVLTLVILLTSCGEYVPPTGTGNQGGNNSGNSGYNPDDPNTGGNTGNGGNGGEQGGEETPNYYSVSLVHNGQPFIPDEEIVVTWSNGFAMHQSLMTQEGVAYMTGINGNFSVTIDHAPDGYAYNPNIYKATSTQKHVEIELHEVITLPYKKNTSRYDCYEIKQEGIYCIQLDQNALMENESKEVFYEFAPTVSGNYSVESWVSIVENQVSPLIAYYGANKHFKQPDNQAVVEHPTESSYTRNFKFTMELTDSMISDAGQVTFTFSIKATSKTGTYPVYVYFYIYKNNDVEDPYGQEKPMMLPQLTLEKQKDYDNSYTYTYPDVAISGYQVLESDHFKLWASGTGMPMTKLSGQGSSILEQLTGEYSVRCQNIEKIISFSPNGDGLTGFVSIAEYKYLQNGNKEALTYGNYSYTLTKKGEDIVGIAVYHVSDMEIEYAGFTIKNGQLFYGNGDNYYHVWDEENQTYGPILYADITVSTRFVDGAFTTIEDRGNKALTFADGNYKFFIEGWACFKKQPGYFCVNNRENEVYCDCYTAGCGGACVVGCVKCHEECRNVTQELLDSQGGYADYVNGDGRYAVNAELQWFLQTYSIRHNLFFDGNGVAETDPETPVFAAEEDQWLFACGYYAR